MGDRSPFRKAEMTEAELAASYHNKHDLREMYTRENTERRRVGGKNLRRHLSAAQDRLFISKGTKIRDEYQVACNDDVVLVLAQTLIADGKEAELDAHLVAAARKAVIPKRAKPQPPVPAQTASAAPAGT